MIEKIFGHELLKPMLPKFMLDIAKMKRNHQIVESIKFGVYAHLTHGKTNKHYVTRQILGTLAPIQVTNDRKVAKHLGLDRKCIYQTLQCHLLVDDGALDFWIGIKKLKQSNVLSTKVNGLVVEWWTIEITICLNWKKVCKKRMGVN